MAKPTSDNKKIALIAAALIVAAVLLALVLSSAAPQKPWFGEGAPALLKPLVTTQKYWVNGTTINVTSEVIHGNGFTEKTSVSNDGSTPAEVGLLTLVPQPLAADAGFSIDRNGALPAATEFLSLNPLVRFSLLSLGAKKKFSETVSSKSSADAAPLHLLNEPRLTQEKKQKLLPLLKKIVDLNLNEEESAAFEKKFNDAFSRAQEQNNSFDEFLGATDSFVTEVKEAKRAKLLNPSYDYSIEKMSVLLPSPKPSPSPVAPEELFPALPEEIVVEVSETYPANYTVIDLKPGRSLGTLLTKFAGELSGLGSADPTEIPGGEYELRVSVDFSGLDTENGVYPFDEKKDELVLMFSGLPGVSKSVPVIVKVSHVNLNTVYQIDNKGKNGETPLTPDLIKQAVTSPPLKPVVESVNEEKMSGGLLCPVAGPITSPYGNRVDPISKVWMMHWGIDIGAACGTAIKAPADGVIEALGPAGGCGNSLSIDHGRDASGKKIFTRYCHIQDNGFKVKQGDRVTQGQTVALVGTTGYSTGCHLHFEVKVDGNPQNPAKVVTSCGVVA